MNIIRKIIIGLGSLVGVALVFALASPRTVHAVVSALVTVSNTIANPAITADADKSTRIPYLSTRVGTLGSTGPTVEEITGFAAVPTGYRLVIQNVSFDMPAGSGNPVPWARICTNTAPTDCWPSFTGAYTGSAAQGQTAILNEDVVRYVSAGDSPIVKVHADVASGEFTVSVAGYLENCAVTDCLAVVH